MKSRSFVVINVEWQHVAEAVLKPSSSGTSLVAFRRGMWRVPILPGPRHVMRASGMNAKEGRAARVFDLALVGDSMIRTFLAVRGIKWANRYIFVA